MNTEANHDCARVPSVPPRNEKLEDPGFGWSRAVFEANNRGREAWRQPEIPRRGQRLRPRQHGHSAEDPRRPHRCDPDDRRPALISPSDVLILMACSGSKAQTRCKMPLFDLYTGPLWQSLKTHMGDVPRKNVFVLSGQFGFQSATPFESAPYDARLGPIQAERLIARGAFEPTDFDGATKWLKAQGHWPLQWLGWGASRRYRAVIICASNLADLGPAVRAVI
ncbi:hypothetical protein M2322_004558 [Rhodoblastus acidophilus]|uniref:hypothetical protein n=1 Tax=Rhodoblastus acidophilus TaxID=1074 RepID=UPI002224D24E|nr:hypothetical protein [Rhodoblastus acidophilus]MCW2318989.1 hypothetical protein [Rhodoblastus acidophilus]